MYVIESKEFLKVCICNDDLLQLVFEYDYKELNSDKNMIF